MGQIASSRLIIVILCISLAGSVIFLRSRPLSSAKADRLYQFLSDIEGWDRRKSFALDQEIVDALELDDYININYHRGKQEVSLYVGYYYSTDKIGTSHSPLVCFPGQGWVLSNRERKVIHVDGNTINLEKMIAARGDKKELIIYWFQAYDKTSPGTFMQKVNNFLITLKGNNGNNAFVRVTVPIENNDAHRAYQIGIYYIRSFYPRFLSFIKS